MNRLYISDLDGTLLQPDVTLSQETIAILNKLIDKGILFTVATARTIASVKYLLQDVNLNVPIILMNGVCIYDLTKKKYIKVETIPSESMEQIILACQTFQQHCFIYSIDSEGKMVTYYDTLETKGMIDFYEERVNKYQKLFTKLDSFDMLYQEPVVYFSCINTKEALEPLYQEILQIDKVNCVFYKDNYSPDLWYLEVFSVHASKYHALTYLKSYLQVTETTCFGDNRNDLPLFQGSTYKIAVENAVAELKEEADLVIGNHSDNSVALWLEENV